MKHWKLLWRTGITAKESEKNNHHPLEGSTASVITVLILESSVSYLQDIASF